MKLMKLITLIATAFICVDACAMDWQALEKFQRNQKVRASYAPREAIQVVITPASQMPSAKQIRREMRKRSANVWAQDNELMEDLITLTTLQLRQALTTPAQVRYPGDTIKRAAKPVAGKAPAKKEELELTPERTAAVSVLSGLFASPARQLFPAQDTQVIVAPGLLGNQSDSK